MKSCILLLIFLVLSLIRGWAGPRLAILADDGFQPIADLLAAGFSQSQGIEMVDRAEIQRIAAEHQLQEFASRGDFKKAGAFLHAQGLIVLTCDARSKPPMVAARLVAVEQGVVIDTMGAESLVRDRSRFA
jgi:hypothetical protein